MTGSDPRPGGGRRSGPSAQLRGSAPTALPGRAWRGACAVGAGRGRTASLSLSHGAPPPHRLATAFRRAAPGVAAEADGGVPNKAGEPSPAILPARAQASGSDNGNRRHSPAHRERGLSGAAAPRPRMGAERGGGDWPERFPSGRPRGGGVCSDPRLPRCRHTLTWRPPSPGRAGGASAEWREPGPSAALSAEGNNRPERRLRRATVRPFAPPPPARRRRLLAGTRRLNRGWPHPIGCRAMARSSRPRPAARPPR